jgi:LysR family nod box-dependent transcriptional activator
VKAILLMPGIRHIDAPSVAQRLPRYPRTPYGQGVTAPSISRHDLNLLVYLDALLAERSVTRAAQRLMLSQPAMSAALSRLRTHFRDPILARDGNTYRLTPLAERLAEETGFALDAARRVFENQADWDPHESTREFTVLGSDYAFVTLGAAVTALATQRAPHVRFRFTHHTPQIVDAVAEHLRTVDAILIPHGFIDGLPHRDVVTDDWVILAATDNDAVSDVLTTQDLATAPWVFTYMSRSAFTPASLQLQQLGLEPKVECVVDGFLALPAFVAGTRRLALVQRHLSALALHHPGIRVLECPFEATPITEALWWHPVRTRDPEHAWMRELFVEAGRAL